MKVALGAGLQPWLGLWSCKVCVWPWFDRCAAKIALLRRRLLSHSESNQALFPYACAAVVDLRQSELGEVLGLTNEL